MKICGSARFVRYPPAAIRSCARCHVNLTIHRLRRYRAPVKISIKMKAISRRQFLQVAGAAMLVAALPAAEGHGNGQGPKRVRVRPLAHPNHLRPGEIAFCRRARFSTAAGAILAVAARGLDAEIYVE